MDKFLKRKAGVLEGAASKKVAPADEKNIQQAKKKKATSTKIEGQTVEQHRRALGDKVKSNIQVEKWAIEARTSMQTKTALEVFEKLIVPHASQVTPATFNKTTPVVVAQLKDSKSIGEVFGHSKIKGGTRMGSWTADKADIIYFPPTGELRAWWTMK